MRINQKIVIVILVLLSFCLQVNACTTFVLKRNGTILLGKNLDWFINDGFIVVNNRGVEKTAFLMNNSSAAKWKSRYGSITFNQFGKEFPLGGMNEKGLVIEEMSYNPSQYSSNGIRYINEFQWIQYHLDTSKTVKEVIANLDSLSISPILFKLHYMICDSQGQMAIVEFIHGETEVYTGDEVIVPILTNTSYENSLKYLEHHKGFGGERVVSDGPESPERFVRTAILIKNISNINIKLTEEDGFDILNSVKQTDTQWSIVYNLTAKEIHFTTQNIPIIRSLSLSDFNFVDSGTISNITTYDSTKIKQQFAPYSIEKNCQLLKTVFGKLITADENSKDGANKIMEKLIDYTKK